MKKYGDKVGMGCVQKQPHVQHPQATPACKSLNMVFGEIVPDYGKKQCFNLALRMHSDSHSY